MTTLSQLKELSNEELRRCVAEAVGWVRHKSKTRDFAWIWKRKGDYCYALPAYADSLDKMHEAEKTLSDEEHAAFRAALRDLSRDPNASFTARSRNYISSEAKERAIAFLYVKQKI